MQYAESKNRPGNGDMQVFDNLIVMVDPGFRCNTFEHPDNENIHPFGQDDVYKNNDKPLEKDIFLQDIQLFYDD